MCESKEMLKAVVPGVIDPQEGRSIGEGSIHFNMDDKGLTVHAVGFGEVVLDSEGFKEVVLSALKSDFDNAECPCCRSNLELNKG